MFFKNKNQIELKDSDNVKRASKYALKQIFEVVVTCTNETELQETFEQLQAEGYKCRVLIL